MGSRTRRGGEQAVMRRRVSGGQRTARETARLVVSGVLAAVLAVFVVLNTKSVEINFVVEKASVPLILVLASTGALGVVIGLLLARRRY